jgi:hypothetical protein
MNDFYTQVFSTIAAGALAVSVAFLWKIIIKIDPILEFMKENKAKDIEQDDRLDVHDRLQTILLKKNIDSKLIASGDIDFPDLPQRRREQ